MNEQYQSEEVEQMVSYLESIDGHVQDLKEDTDVEAYQYALNQLLVFVGHRTDLEVTIETNND